VRLSAAHQSVSRARILPADDLDFETVRHHPLVNINISGEELSTRFASKLNAVSIRRAANLCLKLRKNQSMTANERNATSTTLSPVSVTIAADENFAIVDHDGWPLLSCYRRPGGQMELFFEHIDALLDAREGNQSALERLRRRKVLTLADRPGSVQVISSPGCDEFIRDVS